jgi:hypothetical protein
VISYFWKMTMTRKLPFFIAFFGMIIASLTSLILPIYYTRIVDIVQTTGASKATVFPVLMGILVAMAIVEIFSIT